MRKEIHKLILIDLIIFHKLMFTIDNLDDL